MNQQIIDLYDEFTHGHMERRDFLGKLEMAGGLCPTLKRRLGASRPVVNDETPPNAIYGVSPQAPSRGFTRGIPA